LALTEQKKKKSSSVKSNKSATEEAPQLNATELNEPVGDEAVSSEPPPMEGAPPETDAEVPVATEEGQVRKLYILLFHKAEKLS